MEPGSTPQVTATVAPWLIVILCSTITVLAGVIAFLFKFYNKKLTRAENDRKSAVQSQNADREEFAAREESWATEREGMRAAYEQKHRELLQRYDEIIAHERDACRDHEDLMRKEFAEVMTRVASEATKSSAAIVEMLDKLRDRLTIGPRTRY